VAVCKEILTILIEICNELDIEKDNIPKWEDMLERLPEYRINKDGALAEWIDPENPDRYDHRHISHLYPVFPGNEALPDSLFLAAKKALDFRSQFKTTSAHGLVHMGLMSARLSDSEKVRIAFDRIAQGNYYFNSMATSHNRNHDIFNLDCAMSFPTLVMQSLIISRPGFVDLMPTWPASLPNGKINGLVTHAGVKVDMVWENGQLQSATFYPIEDTKLKVRYKEKITYLDLKRDVRSIYSLN
jgi:alpha-L-fucosidase 2